MSGPKLILHFDINGTITAIDSTETGSDHENANMTLSRSVYGKIINNSWVLNDNYADDMNSISYYDYLKSITKDYKKISFLFTNDDQPGAKLKYLLNDVVKYMSVLLFESFFKVLTTYPDACIVFRSFGKDIQIVLDELKSSLGFRDAPIIKIEHSNDDIVFVLSGEKFNGINEINQLYLNSSTHLAIQEDYHYWNNNKRIVSCGKTIGFDKDLVQIFFDDNECVHIMNNDQCHYIKVNTLDALVNKNYFIDHIKKKLISIIIR